MSIDRTASTRRPRTRGILRDVKARCQSLREQIRARAVPAGIVSEQELDEYWPGGLENPSRAVWGWVFCYAQMVRLNARIWEQRERRDSTADAAEQRAVLDALRAEPTIVRLPRETDDGTEEPRLVSVHPKGFDALQWFASRDALVTWLAEQREKILARAVPEGRELVEHVGREIVHQHQLMAWAAMHRGPWLPWEPEHMPAAVPEEIAALSPLDVVLIIRGFAEVNAVRLHALTRLLTSRMQGTDARASWATFFANANDQHGIDTELLMRDHALTKLIAAALTAADARLESMERAKHDQANHAGAAA